MQIVDLRILGSSNYKLLSPIYFRGLNYEIDISEDFVCDLASIPMILWSIIGCPIDFAFAGIIHDALYRSRLLSQKEADYIFFLALRSQGVEKAKARAMYLAVRAAGEDSYNAALPLMAHYRNYVSVLPINS